jgi:ribose transport system permease protein
MSITEEVDERHIGGRERLGRAIGISRIDRFSGLYLAAAFIVVFGVWKPDYFLTSTTLHTGASGDAINGMVALALIIPLAGGLFDLSVGANANLATVIVTILQVQHHWNPVAAIAFAIGCSVMIGCVNAFVVVQLHVNSFIATLGTSSIILAVQVIVSPTQPTPVNSSGFYSLANANAGGFQVVVVYLFVLAIICWWFLERTATGRSLYALGGNAEAARLSGINVRRLTWMSFIMSATICGIAGVLYASQFGPSLTYGQSLLLPAFAAAFLGSTQLMPGRVNVWGTIIAMYVLAIGVQGMEFVTSQQWMNEMFNGVALVGAVAFAGWRQRSARAASEGRAGRTGRARSAVDAAVSRAAPDGVASGGKREDDHFT